VRRHDPNHLSTRYSQIPYGTCTRSSDATPTALQASRGRKGRKWQEKTHRGNCELRIAEKGRKRKKSGLRGVERYTEMEMRPQFASAFSETRQLASCQNLEILSARVYGFSVGLLVYCFHRERKTFSFMWRRNIRWRLSS
jgi:hypothetical protein